MPTTVIIGGGIIGLSTAFYLSQSSPSHRIHILDSNDTLFACASGRAAGFIARDWYAAPSAALGELSFQLHRELAQQHDGARRWGYAGCTGLQLTAPATLEGSAGATGDWLAQNAWLFQNTSRGDAVTAERRAQLAAQTGLPPWVRAAGETDVLSTPDDSAVVHPLRLCRFLEAQCRAAGVHIRLATTARAVVTGAADGAIQGVALSSGETLACDALLIAAGAWSARVFDALFPASPVSLNISSLAGHSLVLRSPHWKGAADTACHALFTTDADGWSPEIFARPDGTIYIAGLNSAVIPLPEKADDVAVLDEERERVVQVSRKIMGADIEVVQASLCHRPITNTGTPFVARIPERKLGLAEGAGKGVFVASGHGPWGIALSLGTGFTMAEKLEGKETTVDVSGLGLHL